MKKSILLPITFTVLFCLCMKSQTLQQVTTNGSITNVPLTLTAPLNVYSPIIVGQNIVLGDILLQGRYSGGSLFTLGTLQSSGNPFLGYGVKPTPHSSRNPGTVYPSTPYLSSLDRNTIALPPLGRAVVEIAGAESKIKFLTGEPQPSTDGGAVTLIEAVTVWNKRMGIGTTAPAASLDVRGDIWTNGTLNVGTIAPPVGYKLAIDGDAIAKRVVVKQNIWADFVFKPDYELPSLTSVEQHIKEKGHLANIPSEKEVAQSGIDLGSMDAKLLQKIEELTLYLIKQDKQLAAQQKEINALKETVRKNK